MHRLIACCLLAARVAEAQSGAPDIVAGASLDATRDINFASGVWPARAWVGQQVTYQIGIFLSEEMRARLRSNPQFVPPDVRSIIAYDLPVPPRLFSRMEGGRRYDVHVFARAMFPVASGTLDIAPARLTYQVPLSSSIFSREESHSAQTSAHRLVVSEPPAAGRPAGFSGAVGRLSVRARADAATPRVGVPFTYTVTVSGIGNVGLFPRPALEVPWAHTVIGPERVRVDSGAMLISGDKHFEWVVTPRDAGDQRVPELRYPYFNPYTERYEVAVVAPLGMRVQPGGLVTPEASADSGATALSIRRRLRGDVGQPWATTWPYWVLLAAVPFPALWRVQRRRQRRPARTASLQRLRQLSGGVVADPELVRRYAREFLAERLPGVRGDGLANLAGLERGLRRAGVSQAVARELCLVIAELDEGSFSGRGMVAHDLAQRVYRLATQVDEEAMRGGPFPLRGALVIVGMLLLVGVTAASAAGNAETSDFAEGLRAYDAREFGEATLAFGRVADERPRAADAWANLGTAAWEAGDTATAVRGWQRALRLDPLAEDARVRLRATPSFRDGWLGDVPPVPLNALATLGAALWVLGWWRFGGRRAGRAVVLPLAAAAGVGVGMLYLAERLSGAREVVVTGVDRLLVSPVIGSQSAAQVVTGETARVVAHQGAWVQIRMDGGRVGWIDARRTASLAVPRAS
jgi:tetratricopeptide (TPR) repeat protein